MQGMHLIGLVNVAEFACKLFVGTSLPCNLYIHTYLNYLVAILACRRFPLFRVTSGGLQIQTSMQLQARVAAADFLLHVCKLFPNRCRVKLCCTRTCTCCVSYWEPRVNFDVKSGRRRIRFCSPNTVKCPLHSPGGPNTAHSACKKLIVKTVQSIDKLAIVIPEATCTSACHVSRARNGQFRTGWDSAIDVLVVLSCDSKIAFEVDGLSHDREEARGRDAKKDLFLERKGIKVVRVDIRKPWDADAIAAEVRRMLGQ